MKTETTDLNELGKRLIGLRVAKMRFMRQERPSAYLPSAWDLYKKRVLRQLDEIIVILNDELTARLQNSKETTMKTETVEQAALDQTLRHVQGLANVATVALQLALDTLRGEQEAVLHHHLLQAHHHAECVRILLDANLGEKE